MDAANNTSKPHPFAHLGPAPYRLVGLEDEGTRAAAHCAFEQKHGYSLRSTLMGYQDEGTSCDHCGTSITIAYRFRAANGAEFKVGCDCAEKACTTGDDTGLLKQVKKAKSARNAKLRKAREAAKVAAARALIDDNREKWAAMPHPFSKYAAQGQTMLDSLERRWGMSGASGRIRLGKEIAALLGE